MPAPANFRFREVDSSNWDDLRTLIEARGGPHHCWCLVWRESGAARAQLDLAGRREAMHDRVEAGTPVGLLAYLEEEPVAWCSVAPREALRPLGGIEYLEGTHVWAVVCFFIARAHRRQGLSALLLDAAVRVAKQHGADVVEASPVDEDSPSYRFMGYRTTFREAGFEDVQPAGSRRHVMHRPLTARGRRMNTDASA